MGRKLNCQPANIRKNQKIIGGRPLLETLKSKRQIQTKTYIKMRHLPEKENLKQKQKKIEELKALGYIH